MIFGDQPRTRVRQHMSVKCRSGKACWRPDLRVAAQWQGSGGILKCMVKHRTSCTCLFFSCFLHLGTKFMCIIDTSNSPIHTFPSYTKFHSTPPLTAPKHPPAARSPTTLPTAIVASWETKPIRKTNDKGQIVLPISLVIDLFIFL